MSTRERRREDVPTVKKVYRTVTPPFRGHRDAEMTSFAYVYFAALLVLLIPLLPFLLVGLLVGKVLRAVRGGVTR